MHLPIHAKHRNSEPSIFVRDLKNFIIEQKLHRLTIMNLRDRNLLQIKRINFIEL